MDPGVRKSIMDNLLSSFAQTNPAHRMDRFFAQAESMCALRVCLNDECMPVRNSAITLMGSLSDTNPAAVYPALRRHLHQLLTDIENCLDSKHLEESTLLLASLITTCPNLVLPNLAIIQSKLVAKLVEARQRIAARADGKSKSGHSMTTSILKTIGCLAQAASVKFRPYVPEVLYRPVLLCFDPCESLWRPFLRLRSQARRPAILSFVQLKVFVQCLKDTGQQRLQRLDIGQWVCSDSCVGQNSTAA